MDSFFHSSLLRLVLLCAYMVLPARGTGRERPLYRVSYRDSIVLEEGSHILSTFFRLENESNAPLDMGIGLVFPPHWKILGKTLHGERTNFSLGPGKKQTIPISLLRTQGVTAGWKQLKVLVWMKGHKDTTVYFIQLHVMEKPDFRVEAQEKEKFFSRENPDTLAMAVQIKNTGNVSDNFHVASIGRGLFSSYRAEVRLLPGQDTTVVSYLKIKQRDWRDFQNQTIPFSVTSSFSGRQQQAYFKIRKVSSRLNLPPPTQKEIPLIIGGGVLVNGNRLSYFGQLSTSYQFGKHAVGFSYRSKELGDAVNSYQLNAFSITYRYKDVQFLAGQIPSPKNFYTFGQGASIRYRKANKTFSLSAIKHNQQQQGFTNRASISDNIFAAADYRIRKVSVSQQLESDFNNVFGLNSYLFHNEASIWATDKTRLKLFGGWGATQKTRAADSLNPLNYGWAGGYEYLLKVRNWRINSNIRYRSSNYPGIFQGVHFQRHELLRDIGNYYLGPAFYYNGVERNTLIDTLYNTNYLTINSLKAGLVAGFHFTRVSASVSLGQLRQLGRQYTYGAAHYADLNLTAKIFDKTELRVNTNNAFIPVTNKTIFSTNAQIQVSGNRLGFNGFYNRFPNGTEGDIRLYETVIGGPVYNQSFFNRALLVSLRYSFAKTFSEESIRHGIGGQINFSGSGGTNVGISGFYPLKDPTRTDLPITEIRSGNLHFTQKIGIRTGKKTSFDLRVVLFVDANNNRICDSGETRMQDAFLVINSAVMLTDFEGMAQCRHLPAGVVRLNFLKTKVHGLVPVAGVVQKVALQQDETIYIAFKEGKKITGVVQIINDTLSHTAMTAENIKILITDSFGIKYYALTDKGGHFSCSVPEGKYKVSLNEEVFSGTDFTPQQIQFPVNLNTETEATVTFIITQRKRKIRFLKTDN